MADPRAILSTNIVFPDGDIPSIIAALPSENTVASAATLNLSGTTGLVVDVTGTTTITAITLAQGESRLLRFNNSLTITVGASILTPGVKNISTVNGTYMLVLGGAAGVVGVVELVRDGIRPSKEFENLYIGTLYALNAGLGFYIDLSAGANKQAWVKGDNSGEIIWDIGGLNTLNIWAALNASGTVALTDGTLPAGSVPVANSDGVLVDSGLTGAPFASTTSILLSSTVVDFDTLPTTTDLYTVPAGRKLIVTDIFIHDFNNNGSVADFGFQDNHGNPITENSGQVTLTRYPVSRGNSLGLRITQPNYSSRDTFLIVTPQLAAGDIVQFNLISSEGSPLNGTVDLYGYLVDSVTGAPILNTGGGGDMMKAGVTSGSNADAGDIGEYVESLIAVGSATALTTATAKNVTSLTLDPGDWDLEGIVSFSTASATFSAIQGGINSTSATIPTDGSEAYSGVTGTALSAKDSVTCPRKRFNITVTTTIYLVAKATFSVGSVSAFGQITARRVR